MAKTVVVEKDSIKKTIPEAYKSDYIVAGWKEVTETEKKTETAIPPYSYNAKM